MSRNWITDWIRQAARYGAPPNHASFYPTMGRQWFLDTEAGLDSKRGDSWAHPVATMERILDQVASHDIVYAFGDIREQLVAPLGVQGVRIFGVTGGRPRHDDGVRWREAATAGDAPLLELREQGWALYNMLMVPQDTFSAIKLHRAESATYPDASHAIFKRLKIIGSGADEIGIEDYGGMHNVEIDDCEFMSLASAIIATNVSIANPLRNYIHDNVFLGNTLDVAFNGSQCRVERNRFMTPYHGTTHPTTLNLAYTADPATGNFVIDNIFADAAANVVPAKGYKPSTGDVWRNKVTDTAADIVAVPAD